MTSLNEKYPNSRRAHDGVAAEIRAFVHDELAEHEAREREFIAEEISNVMQAFPDDDVDAHHNFHKAKIDAAKAEERFWHELKLDLAKKGLWGIITVLVGMVVLGFGAWVGTIGHGAR